MFYLEYKTALIQNFIPIDIKVCISDVEKTTTLLWDDDRNQIESRTTFL